MTRNFSSSFRSDVLETVRREKLLSPGETVVVGFSGGPDSSALLRVLLDLEEELPLRLVAAHLDHALRSESAEDAGFARARAEEWRVPFVAERIDWAEHGGPPRTNVEAAAREQRYAFLQRERGARGGVIAVGHHADDRVETFLANLLRGAGPRGLSLPRHRREDGVVRPLLDRTRAEILRYLEARGVSFRRDPSNEDGSNLRSRLRTGVVPALIRESPDLARHVGRTASLLRDLTELLEEQALAAAAELRRDGRDGELVLDGPGGRPYHRLVLSTILRNAIRGLAPDSEAGFAPLERLARAWQSGSRESVDLPGFVRVAVSEERVVVSAGPAARALPADRPARDGFPETEPAGRLEPGGLHEQEVPVPGFVHLGGLEARLTVEELSPPPADAKSRSSSVVAWLDAGEVRPPVRVRSRRAGDRYRPVGLPGTAKVQDLMVDRKIPRRFRDQVPLVVDDRGILWIPGFRVDARTRITDTTVKALRLEVSGTLPYLTEALE